MSEPHASSHERDEARRREALATLDKLRGDDTFATSGLAGAARRTAAHFSGKDAIAPDGSFDPAELWGRRIGRALSFIAVIGLAIYLYVTYLQ